MRARNVIYMISGGGSTCLEGLLAQKPGGFLHEVVKTVCIITSDPNAGGIEKAIKKAGFPEMDIRIAVENHRYEERLHAIFEHYQPDFFHQLGSMPKTPESIVEKYKGLNQHFGPGGKYMYGVRRVHAHRVFCNIIGKDLPICVFCQLVAPDYDEGNMIHHKMVDLDFGMSDQAISDMLLPIEHQVQLTGSLKFAIGGYHSQSVHCSAKTSEEKEMLQKAILNARDMYPPEK